jgi:aspartate aminotransferase
MVRKMFEEGNRLSKIYGADKVYDFSLGNPVNEPPVQFHENLKKLANQPIPGMHRYMSNAGYPETRNAVAAVLAEKSGLDVTLEHVVMTVGAGGGLNVVLKSILDPGDEVIALVPYFGEYKFYADNHGGILREVSTDDNFMPNIKAIENAINEKTRAIIINTPNNPTGVVYPAEVLTQLDYLINNKSQHYNKPIYVISDEPYAKIAYDVEVPNVFKYIDNSIIVTSHSKDLALPGERIGYVAACPKIKDVDLLTQALVFCNRVLGFVNAPALMQHLVKDLQQESVNIAEYQEKRDLLYNGLIELGFECTKPQGAFYLFPKSPLADDVEFSKVALKYNILLVPGTGYGKPGYFRLSYSVDKKMIENSLPAWRQLAEELGLKK